MAAWKLMSLTASQNTATEFLGFRALQEWADVYQVMEPMTDEAIIRLLEDLLVKDHVAEFDATDALPQAEDSTELARLGAPWPLLPEPAERDVDPPPPRDALPPSWFSDMTPEVGNPVPRTTT